MANLRAPKSNEKNSLSFGGGDGDGDGETRAHATRKCAERKLCANTVVVQARYRKPASLAGLNLAARRQDASRLLPLIQLLRARASERANNWQRKQHHANQIGRALDLSIASCTDLLIRIGRFAEVSATSNSSPLERVASSSSIKVFVVVVVVVSL